MSKQKKILFILHIPPPTHGAAMVGKQIQTSSVINNTFNCRYINLGISASVDEIGKNGIRKALRYFTLIWQVFFQLISFKPQLCYFTPTAQGIGLYKDLPLIILAKLFGSKTVFHFHNKGITKRHDIFFDNLLYRWLFKKSEVILLSKYLYPDIQKYKSEKSVHFCANGIPELKAQKSNRIIANHSANILFLSNLIESKGVFVLLEACKILYDKEFDFKCTFVGGIGDLTEKQFQEKVSEFGINDFVNYAGKKYGKEKEEAFSNADIFAFPTYYQNECFPLVLLEAMQFSLPVVSTFEGGIRDIVDDGETGYLVPQKDVVALSEKLEYLILNGELRQQMGIAGRVKYEKEYTLNTFEIRIKEILNKILSK